MPARCRTVLMILAGLLPSPACLAERVQLPIALDYRVIESLLREQVFTGADGGLRVNDDGSGCQYLKLSRPRVGARNGSIVLTTDAEARAGRALGGRCLLILDWRGGLEFVQEASVAEHGRSIVLETSSWRALRPDGSTDNVSTNVGQWLEEFLPVTLKQTRIDFAGPLQQLEDFLALSTVPAAARAEAVIDGIALDAVAVDSDRATVTVGLEAPAVRTPARRMEPALGDAELERLSGQLDALDAFFTHTVKSLGSGREPSHENRLFEVLMELRGDLVAILRGRQVGTADPARALFVEAWEGLAPVLRDIAGEQANHADALRYLTFISAGDALRVLDELGPAAGIEVSADGLRRLARILTPDDSGDPLGLDPAVDPELRRSLGFGPPILPPTGSPTPPPQPDTSWLHWLIPGAVAAEGLDPAVVTKLNNWVPRPRDMQAYLPMVRQVLSHVVTAQLGASELDPDFHQVFRWLVYSAAWQESCWRQFVAENDMRVPVESASGDLGMMQINPRVWRGLYDLHGLRWDIVYNGRAGADILEHYLIHYAIRHGEHRTTGSVDNLARSAYAAYNGGPSQYDRYRSADASAHGRKVDALFLEKYREVKGGAGLAVSGCYEG